jgi:hypothetical protein
LHLRKGFLRTFLLSDPTDLHSGRAAHQRSLRNTAALQKITIVAPQKRSHPDG